MVFLDDFVELLDELPSELRGRCNDIKKLDTQVQSSRDKFHKTVLEFFAKAPKMSVDEKQKEFNRLNEEWTKIRAKAQKKVEIAEKMQDLLEKCVDHLEKDREHFKNELEADNPGITQQIEKRFTDFIEALLASKKESRRRKNGPTAFIPAFSSDDSFLASGIALEDELFNPDWGKPKNRRGSGTSSNDEAAPIKRKPPRNSLTAPVITGQTISPSASEKSWTPFGGISHDSSPAPPGFHGTNIAMPNFSGPESRHGRQRKLTSRVQEMFNNTLQRQRSYHVPVEEPEEGASESSSEDDEESRKTWCTCKQKSYGNMVACDNDKCPFEWFHYHCVGITAPPRGKWFCPHCSEQLRAPSHGLDLNF
ncbi:unnamed protein product, partial [Mesorhabditis belari]|uniref:Inhibitor of growth protein n=1 Tax=Mesorhabditis belari TaxID=2138241 RepID=A0AAF3EN17_9BILA